VNNAVITTQYSNKSFVLHIFSCLHSLDCVYKHVWQSIHLSCTRRNR